jgi:L,D-transpeptidase YcbB
LASFVMTGDADQGLTKLTDAVETHQTQTIALDESVPVYLEYWTAVADPDGLVGFRPDRYSRDAILLARLASPPPQLRIKSAEVSQAR